MFYPTAHTSIALHLEKTNKRFIYLRKGPLKTEKMNTGVFVFNTAITEKVFDVRTNSKNYQKKLEERFQVKTTQIDENLYKDNCSGMDEDTCGTMVDQK